MLNRRLHVNRIANSSQEPVPILDLILVLLDCLFFVCFKLWIFYPSANIIHFWTYFPRNPLCTFFSSCKNQQKYSLLSSFVVWDQQFSKIPFFILSVHLIWMQGLTKVHNNLRLLIFFLMVLVWFMIRNKLLKERLRALSINYFA